MASSWSEIASAGLKSEFFSKIIERNCFSRQKSTFPTILHWKKVKKVQIKKFNIKQYFRSQSTNYFPIGLHCKTVRFTRRTYGKRSRFWCNVIYHIKDRSKPYKMTLDFTPRAHHFWPLFTPWSQGPPMVEVKIEKIQAYKNAPKTHEKPWTNVFSFLKYQKPIFKSICIILTNLWPAFTIKYLPLSWVKVSKFRFTRNSKNS